MRNGDTIVIMKKCKCGRVYKFGEWIRPQGKDLQDIVDAIYRQEIRFIDEDCGRHDHIADTRKMV